ncbi:MAG: hypothetical protein LBJ00_08325 [Planctomycetaceae bacterium]|nr:hypothetical protein [Planctomycetaceae bacterium]
MPKNNDRHAVFFRYNLVVIGEVWYTEATLKFLKLNTQAQQREAVVQGRSPSPYRLRLVIP